VKKIAVIILSAVLCCFATQAFALDVEPSINKNTLQVVISAHESDFGPVNVYIMKPGKDLLKENILLGLHDMKQVIIDMEQSVLEFGFGGTEPSGEYTVYAVSANDTKAAKFTYLNDEDTISALIGQIKSTQTPYDLISENTSVFQVDQKYTDVFLGFSQTQKKHFDTMFKAKRAFATKAEFEEFLISCTVLTDLETATHTTILDRLKFYPVLNISFAKYNNLSATAKTKVLKDMSDMTFGALGDVKSSFDGLVDYYGRSSPESTGGGGGLGGGAPIAKAVFTPSEDEENTNNEEDAFDMQSFADLQDVQWAKESIEYLFGKGVIRGKGDNLFMPSDMVTREEFVKMIVEAFNISGGINLGTYADVDENQWYAPYVYAATSAGIINGSDGVFGVGTPITRQDMAAICYRSLQHFKVVLPAYSDDVMFSDINDVAEYARESVLSMAKSGILNGKGNNMFMPYDNATRAEAAKVIYEILKFAKLG
jgi:hypothetical protein